MPPDPDRIAEFGVFPTMRKSGRLADANSNRDRRLPHHQRSGGHLWIFGHTDFFSLIATADIWHIAYIRGGTAAQLYQPRGSHNDSLYWPRHQTSSLKGRKVLFCKSETATRVSGPTSAISFSSLANPRNEAAGANWVAALDGLVRPEARQAMRRSNDRPEEQWRADGNRWG